MAKRRRRSRSRTRRRRPSLVLIVLLLVVAAGFITRRVLAPRAMHFLTHRSAAPAAALRGESPQPNPVYGADGNLTDSDRRALDRIVRERSGR
ncbi:MAG TPA: hypothetical protein VGI29_11345 [Candidatus Binataceae bacterium]|jgi:hypothetical protein